jgi:pimeloyl-ACP methyl ester carboxylesterase
VKVLAVHGLPTSPRLWERLQLPPNWELTAPQVPGLGDEGTPSDWSLESCVEELSPLANNADLLVGHDLGGVLSAMMARPGQSVILSGTALGLYWSAIRLTTLPQVHRWFYERHGGRRFLAGGCLPEHAGSLLEAFGDHGPDWAARMRRIAKGMKPPRDLARRLRSCGVRLIWGRRDPWYPHRVAGAVQRTTGGQLHWLSCGHFAPWEDPRGFAAVLTGRDQRPE